MKALEELIWVNNLYSLISLPFCCRMDIIIYIEYGKFCVLCCKHINLLFVLLCVLLQDTEEEDTLKVKIHFEVMLFRIYIMYFTTCNNQKSRVILGIFVELFFVPTKSIKNITTLNLNFHFIS